MFYFNSFPSSVKYSSAIFFNPFKGYFHPSQVNKEKVVMFIHHYLRLVAKYSDLEILDACGKLVSKRGGIVSGHFRCTKLNVCSTELEMMQYFDY